MRRPPSLRLCLASVALSTIPVWGQVNQEMIDRVAAGELKEAKASWWGFNEEDATDALQAAINSGVPKLTVDNVGKPWIVRPIALASNQEILFEEGVEVVAKRGEFKGKTDALFAAANKENISLIGYGATLRMHRADYDNRELYEKAEWRHVVSILSCTNIKVYGLELAESGGDGIYLGTRTRWVTNKNIHIKDVVCESNYRQGISVITAEDLLIENTIMRNTGGTAPQAGIDFEPNNPEERLVNVVMRDCLTENNGGCGYVMYLPPMAASSEPVTMRFEGCIARNDRQWAAGVVNNNTADRAVTGSIEFVNCAFDSCGAAGIYIGDNPLTGLRLRFQDVDIIDPAPEHPAVTPIQIGSRAGADQPVGGVEFRNVRIHDELDRNPISYLDNAGGLPLEGITGSLTLVRGGMAETVELTTEVLARWMPVIGMKRIPRMSLEGVALKPLVPDAQPDSFAFPHGVQRRLGRFVLYADAGEQVAFTVFQQQVGRYDGKTIPVVITDPSGEEVHRGEAPFGEQAEVAFTAPETGAYRITADPVANRISVPASSHPINLLGEGRRIELIHSAGDFRFWVPAGTTEFGVRVAGEGTGEAIRAALINQAGETVGEVDDLAQSHQFEVELPQAGEGEVWTLRLSRPSTQTWEDCSVDLRGVPPILAPTREALLVPVQ